MVNVSASTIILREGQEYVRDVLKRVMVRNAKETGLHEF